ncbi:MAG: hypothetical protein HFG78_03295 [Hungatella sp.]|jgi:hypothetical protein|nr:hypothetical protein [Hungatella sp.]MCI9636504.1 hypothetical protein [Hungatella sp.]
MSVILTTEEKSRRKAIWDKMTKEECQDAENRKDEISRWYREKEDAVYKRLAQEGKLKGGLDGYYPEIIELNGEYKQRLRNLLESLFGEENE